MSRIPMTSDVLVAHRGEVEAALNEAVRLALLDHKRAGNPVAGWRDGKVVIVPPEEIPVVDPLAMHSHPNGNGTSSHDGSNS